VSARLLAALIAGALAALGLVGIVSVLALCCLPRVAPRWIVETTTPYSSEFWVAIITAVGTAIVSVVTAIGGVLFLYMKFRELSHHVNSQLDKYVELERTVSHALGVTDERARATGEPAQPAQPAPPRPGRTHP
jgi:hypothetical protein